MKNKNVVIVATAVGIIGILAIVMLRRRRQNPNQQDNQITPQQKDVVDKLSNTISSGTFKLR